MRKPRTVNRDGQYPVKRDAAGGALCRWDQKPVAKGRRAYCSDQCQIEVDVRTSANALRRHVHDRDKGICAACGIDTDLLRRVLGYAALSASSSEQYGTRRLYPHFVMRWHAPEVWSFANVLGFDLHRHLWEADHVVELSDGGSGGLNNAQTLCIVCHKSKTATNAARRAAERRDASRPLLALVTA
jgi:5-methylcytosine-specific restriction protein A